MDKAILIQYCDMKEEIKCIKTQLKKLDRFLENPPIVSDTVKGTRKDGTIGSIKITGIPEPMYVRKQKIRARHQQLLEKKEVELLELIIQVEEYIQTIPKSELRTMFRLYYIDGLTWLQVAHRMNSMFPNRRIKYTEDNCWRRNQRFLKNVGSCREEM